jgi:hypothetical protein
MSVMMLATPPASSILGGVVYVQVSVASSACYMMRVVARDGYCEQQGSLHISKAELLYSPLGSRQSGSAANQKMPLNALIYKSASQPRRLRPI